MLPTELVQARPRSYGLGSMTERAELAGGRLEVRSRPGDGTAVTAIVPARPG
jgi:two-component system, NarL family, sensor kinase